MYASIQHKISTLGFIGFLPYAPGTFASIASFLLILLLRPGDLFLLFLLVPLLYVGIVTSTASEKLFGKDSSHIVIDEFCGYLISVLFVPKLFGYLVAALILFRIFDIFKLPPVREVEETFGGGIGIMLDDVAAGIITNLCIQFWIFVF